MIPSYVVTFALVSFLWLNELDLIRKLRNFIERGSTEILVSWTIPLLVTEIFISWKKITAVIRYKIKFGQTYL